MCWQKVTSNIYHDIICINFFRFAEQDLYVVLGRLLQRFKLEYKDTEDRDNLGQVWKQTNFRILIFCFRCTTHFSSQTDL